VTDARGDGIYLWYAHGNDLNNNTISNPQEDGIYLEGDATGNIIANNTITGPTNGIVLNYSIEEDLMATPYGGEEDLPSGLSDNTIVGNLISGSTDYGILLTGCSGNTIYGNLLVNNNGSTSSYSSSHIQAYDDGTNYWNSPSYGNYWSD
jgi:parallel beta-helix repeat protein